MLALAILVGVTFLEVVAPARAERLLSLSGLFAPVILSPALAVVGALTSIFTYVYEENRRLTLLALALVVLYALAFTSLFLVGA